MKLNALCISLTLASKTASRLCQSLSIYSTPSRSSTLQSTKRFLRSDNAGCYHGGPMILSLPYIRTRSGVTTPRYDFSDLQAQKDICDRKTAPMKAHIKRWVCDNCRKYERGFRILWRYIPAKIQPFVCNIVALN